MDDEPDFQDPLARAIARGSSDDEKQDGLYVKVGRDGSVVSTPRAFRKDAAKEARERGKRLASFVGQALAGDTRGLIDYERIVNATKVVFQDIA